LSFDHKDPKAQRKQSKNVKIKSKNCVLFFNLFIAFQRNTSLPLIGQTCAIESKKVINSRCPILVTIGKKRSKKFLKLAVFRVQVAAVLIEILTAESTEKNETLNEKLSSLFLDADFRGFWAGYEIPATCEDFLLASTNKCRHNIVHK
jgi:hypothetical protein